MNFLEILRLSFGALNERKVRSGLTILMVIIGVTLMTSLNGLSGGMGNFIDEQFELLAPNVLIITPSEASVGFGPPQELPETKLTLQTVKTIEKTHGVEVAFPVIFSAVTLRAGGEERSVLVMGIDQDKVKHIAPKVSVEDGSYVYPYDSIGVVFGNRLAYPPDLDRPLAKLGQTITLEYLKVETEDGRDKIVVEKKSFQLKGILKELGSQDIDSTAFISVAAANSLLEKEGIYDAIYAVTIDPDYNDIVEERIHKIYGKNIGVVSPKALAETIKDVMDQFMSFISAIALVSMFVGGVGIITTVYTSVMERTREIGLLKAIGYQNRTILFMFLTESLAIGLLGAILGLIAGFGGAYVLVEIMLRVDPYAEGATMSPYFKPMDIIEIFSLSLVLSLVAGLYPAWRASKLSPIKALRKE